MFSLKCLTKKFNKQSLSEVKPAPLSETVDHTVPSANPTAATPAIATTINTSLLTPPSPPLPPQPSDFPHHIPPPPPPPSTSDDYNDDDDDDDDNGNNSDDDDDHTLFTDDHQQQHRLNFTTNRTSSLICTPNSAKNNDNYNDNSLVPTPRTSTMSSNGSFSPSSSPVSSSESDESDEEEVSSPPRPKAYSPRRNFTSPLLRIERISSAEKRKHNHYKCSTGGSSPSSSDDEVKEAFETTACFLHRKDSTAHYAWGQPTSGAIPHFTSSSSSSSSTSRLPSSTTSPSSSSSSSFSSTSSSSSFSLSQPVSAGWSSTSSFEPCSRPHKVVPLGRKHKFFAQMPSSFVDRPFLDFNKMQHSKRLVMQVRRPMVIRNNSRVHSIQRPAPSSLQVSLDISQHSFQPVLMQT